MPVKLPKEPLPEGGGWQRNELPGLDDGPRCPCKLASPSADVKGGLPRGYARGRVKASVTGDAGAEVHKELLLGRGEAQHRNLSDKDEFYSAAATRKRTCLAVRWTFGHKLGRIRAQSALARDGEIKCRRASEAKVIFVGSGAYEARVKGFCSRFDAGNGSSQH